MSKTPYFNLSRFYDNIILDEEYNSWLDTLADFTIKNSPNFKGVDFACGSGIFTRKLKDLKCDVYGVDISQEMLEKAIQSNNKLKYNVQYIKGDMRTFKAFSKVGFITCVNDGINYVKNSDLVKTFKNFYKNLIEGGVAVFDISSEYKFKQILASNVFGDNNENLSYIWFNELSNDGKEININISFFEKVQDKYIRYNEEQTQYIHTEEEILLALKESGFSSIKVFDKNGGEVTSTSDRILFLAKK